MGFIIRILFYQPFFNLLMVLYQAFGGNLGWAIIAVAFIAKIVTIPMTRNQLKSSQQQQKMQAETKSIREKYNKNPEKMNEELLKVSTKYMPAQIGGCLPMIISLLLLIQIRGIVVNLVNKGFRAFNEVAYVETLKRKEDMINFKSEHELEKGKHVLRYEIVATNGKKLDKEYEFYITDDIDKTKEEIKETELEKSDGQRLDEKKAMVEELEKQRSSDIALYTEIFDDSSQKNAYSIALKKFLFIFNSDSLNTYILDENKPRFRAFIRPPSLEQVEQVKIFLNDEDVSEKAEITKGDVINLNFFGIDLSKVGKDYISNIEKFIPYLVLGILLGLSQYFISKIQMSTKPTQEKPKNLNKKKSVSQEEPDFSQMMEQSSKMMIYYMPVFSTAMSLGFIGGANLFPSAVSLFWTVQNAFVIIQMVFMKKKEILEKINIIISKLNINKTK